jgi:hypothetical protein
VKGKEHWYQKRLTQKEFMVFIQEALTGKNNNKAFIGTLEQKTVEKIESICGKKIGKIMIESEGIRHAYKKAGHNLKNDDLLHIIDVINTAADIRVSDITHQNNECLEICKDIDGIITFVMEIRKHYGGWLTLVTCYRQK